MITSYNKLTIEKWQSILEVQSSDVDDYEKELQIISLLTGIRYDELLKKTIGEIAEYKTKLDFLNHAPSENMVKNFKLCGVDYEIQFEVEKKTAGQFVDIATFTSDASKINENLHNLLAVYCLPVGSKYDGETHKGRAEIFKHNLTIDIAFPLCVFFWNLYRNFLKTMANYSTEKVDTMSKELLEEVQSLQINGDGLLQSTTSLEETT